MLNAAGSLAWLQRIVEVDHATLAAEAPPWPPGTEGLDFAPLPRWRMHPHADPEAWGYLRASRCDMTAARSRGATMEGVAYALLARVVGSIGPRLSAGAARS